MYLRSAIAFAFLLMPAASQAGDLILEETGHYSVPVTLENGETHNFVLDTAAQGSAVYEGFAASEDLPLRETGITVQGQTGSLELPVAILRHLAVDELEANEVEAVVLPRRSDGTVLKGIIGLDVIGGSVLEYSLPEMTARFYDNASDAPITNATELQGQAIRGGLITIPLTIDGVSVTGIVDTGAKTTSMNMALARELGIDPHSSQLEAGDTTFGATGHEQETKLARVDEVVFGDVMIERPALKVSKLDVFEALKLSDTPAVLLGANFFRHGSLIVDFANARAWFTPAR